MLRLLLSAAFLQVSVAAALANPHDAKPSPAPPGLRIAVSQGLVNKGPWAAIAAGFEKKTGVQVTTLPCRGPEVVDALQSGSVDAGVMHRMPLCEELLESGVVSAITPWASSGYVLVGPSQDPAKVKGMKEGAAAVGKIWRAKIAFVQSNGQATGQLLESFRAHPDNVEVSKAAVFLPPGEDALATAAKAGAYMLLPRQEANPAVLKAAGMEVMVEDDSNMRRDFVVLLRTGATNANQGKLFKDYLTSPEVAALIRATAAADGVSMPLVPIDPAPKTAPDRPPLSAPSPE